MQGRGRHVVTLPDSRIAPRQSEVSRPPSNKQLGATRIVGMRIHSMLHDMALEEFLVNTVTPQPTLTDGDELLLLFRSARG